MGLLKVVLIGSLSFSQLTAMGAEVDQFTRRGEFLEDSADLINTKANLAIKSSIKKRTFGVRAATKKFFIKSFVSILPIILKASSFKML